MMLRRSADGSVEKRSVRTASPLKLSGKWRLVAELPGSDSHGGNKLPGDQDTNFGDGNPKLPESLTTVNDGYEFVSPVASYPPNAFGFVRHGRERHGMGPGLLREELLRRLSIGRPARSGNWYFKSQQGRQLVLQARLTGDARFGGFPVLR